MMTWIWSKGRRRVDRKVIFNLKYIESNPSTSIIQVSLSLNRGWSLERRAKLSIPSLELRKILKKRLVRSMLLEKIEYRLVLKTNLLSKEIIFQSKLERIALIVNFLHSKGRQPKKIILFLDSIPGQVKLKTWKNWSTIMILCGKSIIPMEFSWGQLKSSQIWSFTLAQEIIPTW